MADGGIAHEKAGAGALKKISLWLAKVATVR